MKILVTGSSGFVGHHVCRNLVDRGHEVRGFDNMGSNSSTLCHRRSQYSGNANNWIGDVRMLSSVRDAMKGIDSVVHLAAKTGVADSMEWPGAYICTNIEGTDNVFKAALEAGIKKVVYASSSSVYGSLNKKGPMREDEAGTGLKSIYAVTKYAQEHVAMMYAGMGMEAIGLRFFSVYGPRGRKDNIVMKTIEAIRTGGELTLYGNGEQMRDFTYVGDVVMAIAKAVELDVEGWNGVMNVGAGEPASVLDVVKLVEIEMNKEASKEMRPDKRLCDVDATWADIELAKHGLEWEPGMSLADGVRMTVLEENSQYGT